MWPPTKKLLFNIRREVNFPIEHYSTCSFQEFINDHTKKRASEFCLERTGIACNELPASLKYRLAPVINWNTFSQISSDLSSNRFDADYQKIWTLIDSEVPALKPKIDELIKNFS